MEKIAVASLPATLISADESVLHDNPTMTSFPNVVVVLREQDAPVDAVLTAQGVVRCEMLEIDAHTGAEQRRSAKMRSQRFIIAAPCSSKWLHWE